MPDQRAEELLRTAQEHLEALELAEAQQTLERALAKYPEHVGVLDALGELLFSLGEVERAVSVFWGYG